MDREAAASRCGTRDSWSPHVAQCPREMLDPCKGLSQASALGSLCGPCMVSPYVPRALGWPHENNWARSPGAHGILWALTFHVGPLTPQCRQGQLQGWGPGAELFRELQHGLPFVPREMFVLAVCPWLSAGLVWTGGGQQAVLLGSQPPVLSYFWAAHTLA
jgi:hypothetical protein